VIVVRLYYSQSFLHRTISIHTAFYDRLSLHRIGVLFKDRSGLFEQLSNFDDAQELQLAKHEASCLIFDRLSQNHTAFERSLPSKAAASRRDLPLRRAEQSLSRRAQWKVPKELVELTPIRRKRRNKLRVRCHWKALKGEKPWLDLPLCSKVCDLFAGHVRMKRCYDGFLHGTMGDFSHDGDFPWIILTI
jgi:hypothetical protein